MPAENKKAVVAELLGDRANPVTVSLLGFVIDAGTRARDPGASSRRWPSGRPANATTRSPRFAAPSRSATHSATASPQALSQATGRTVDVKVVVDPAVVGGVVARVGDEVFDGSVATRLDRAKQQLATGQ